MVVDGHEEVQILHDELRLVLIPLQAQGEHALGSLRLLVTLILEPGCRRKEKQKTWNDVREKRTEQGGENRNAYAHAR